MAPSPLRATLLILSLTLAIPALLYAIALTLLTSFPSLQAHAVYMHAIKLTWFHDLNVPEQFGFAHHQATPFYITTLDSPSERLHAWHILPIGAYRQNEDALLSQPHPEGGLEGKFEETLNFRLLKENPDAKLVLYFHGAGGSVGSGWRPASYRAISAVDSINTHVLAFDYRGFGLSTGQPSEDGLIMDAMSVADWAMKVAGIPPERIVVYGQSMGSAVAIALVHELAVEKDEEDAVDFKGLVVTGTFMDVASLTATYTMFGVVPVLGPVARVEWLFGFFTSRLKHTWDNLRRLAEIEEIAGRFDITFIHAEDDGDVPVAHSVQLFRKAVQLADWAEMDEATIREKISGGVDPDKPEMADVALLERIKEREVQLGEGGSVTTWPTMRGDIRLVVPRYGVHDKLMAYPLTSLAVDRAFESGGKKSA